MTTASGASVARPVCEGFAWCGQSMLSCDHCGQPWFLHPGDRRSTALFGGEMVVVPFAEERQVMIPALTATWEANAFWQRERGRFIEPTYRGDAASYGPDVERQVGKDFPYPTGPTRPVPTAASAAAGTSGGTS